MLSRFHKAFISQHLSMQERKWISENKVQMQHLAGFFRVYNVMVSYRFCLSWENHVNKFRINTFWFDDL